MHAQLGLPVLQAEQAPTTAWELSCRARQRLACTHSSAARSHRAGQAHSRLVGRLGRGAQKTTCALLKSNLSGKVLLQSCRSRKW